MRLANSKEAQRAVLRSEECVSACRTNSTNAELTRKPTGLSAVCVGVENVATVAFA